MKKVAITFMLLVMILTSVFAKGTKENNAENFSTESKFIKVVGIDALIWGAKCKLLGFEKGDGNYEKMWKEFEDCNYDNEKAWDNVQEKYPEMFGIEQTDGSEEFEIEKKLVFPPRISFTVSGLKDFKYSDYVSLHYFIEGDDFEKFVNELLNIRAEWDKYVLDHPLMMRMF